MKFRAARSSNRWSARKTTARRTPPLSGRLLDSMEGVVVAHGICPRYSDIDTYHMTACAIDEAMRNAVAVGADLDHLAGLDNFCWCDPVKSEKTPDGEYKLAQLVRANMAIYDYTTAFGVPCISGKDSMKNDYSDRQNKNIHSADDSLFGHRQNQRCPQSRDHGCQTSAGSGLYYR